MFVCSFGVDWLVGFVYHLQTKQQQTFVSFSFSICFDAGKSNTGHGQVISHAALKRMLTHINVYLVNQNVQLLLPKIT